MTSVWRTPRWLARTTCIVILVMVGSTLLVRFAPGYLSDAREMDPRYAAVAHADMSIKAAQSESLAAMLGAEIGGALHGNLGESEQFAVPVITLIRPRLGVTGILVLRALAAGWILAFAGSMTSGLRNGSSPLWQAPSTILLAIPTAAMATFCFLAGTGGPVLVMSLLIAGRDFKFLHRLLRFAWTGPQVLQARAQGIQSHRLLLAYVLPELKSEIFSLASLSFVTALSALVPIEVIFDVPGVGQLAWNAAMNRDLPVLLAVTMLMALAVTLAGVAPERRAGFAE